MVEGSHITINAFMIAEFKKFGEYSVELILNDIPVHILPLTVSQIPQIS